VCAGRPTDARAHERTAFATLKSSGNTRRAVEFARKAVELLPANAEYRITLARAYAAAGLDVSASGELDRARELAPSDPRIKAMTAELKSEAQHKPKVG
jgi:Flp pilus assembly protein TadD